MTKSNSRRSFLQKIAAVTSGAVLASKGGFSFDNKPSMKKDTIKEIKPLGFQWETSDPFLFCVHHEDFFPKGNKDMGPAVSLAGRQIGQDFLIKDGWRMYHGEKVPGFPGHPHRGFETITVVRKGMVDHTDSQGAAGRYGDGDVQWMTAGKGLLHAEMFPLIHETKENPMELFQIWLNLPKASKFVEPHFKMLWADTIPKYQHKDENGRTTNIEVIAGNIQNNFAPAPPPNSWAANKENEVAIWNIQMEPNASWTLPEAAANINRTLYFYKGDELLIGNQTLAYYHSAQIDSETETILTSGNEECKILILQGKPIGEPVVQHGPFVMNTKEEIQQAFKDYQETEFGGWPWPVMGPVHPREKGRFASHADGRIETKS